MAKKKDSVSKISLTSYDDLFETDESREDLKRERLMEIPISQICDFPDHPYKVKDDESMMELVESIRTRGLIQPVLVRPLENGKYEMVSGHRRKRAFELANIEKIPARVMELTRDEAILSMVDSNLQRDEILPSEKAKAYKMRLEANKLTKTNKLPMEGKVKKGFRFYVGIILCLTFLCSFGVTAFAADDPVAVVNNLSTFIFGLIRAVGLILLGFGIVQVGLSLKSHDPSQRANGFLTVAGGIVITFAKEILDLIVG